MKGKSMVLVMSAMTMCFTSFGNGKKDVDSNVRHWGALVDGIQLSIHLEKESIAVGEDAIMHIFVKHRREVPLYVSIARPHFNLKWVVRDPQGRDIPFVEPDLSNKGRVGMYASTGGAAKLSAGPELEIGDIMLNRYFDLDLVGRYSVTVTLPVRSLDKQSTVEVVSNAVEFRIVEKMEK